MDNLSQDREFLNHLPQGIELDWNDEVKQFGIYLDTKYPNEEDRHAITYSTKISFGSMKVKEIPILQFLSGRTNKLVLVYQIEKEVHRKTGHSGLKTNKSSMNHPFSSPPRPSQQQQQYYQHQYYASPPPQQQQHYQQAREWCLCREGESVKV
jgi:hypothetical protein